MEPDEARTVRAFAGKAKKRDGCLVVPVELRGKKGAREAVFSRGQILLADKLPAAAARLSARTIRPYPQGVADAYASLLFHGQGLQGLTNIEGWSDNSIVALARTAPPPGEWLTQPPRAAWLADPLVLDCAFQMTIFWGVPRHGVPNLPAFVGRYRQFRRSFPPVPVRIAIQVTEVHNQIVRADIEFAELDGELIARLEGAEFVEDAALRDKFRQRGAVVSI